MQAYLKPEADGLAMREAGIWAKAKLDYLARYIDVFETAMRKKWSVRYYIDLLAGPGKNLVRESGEVLLGSPLIALKAKYPFTGYYFVDLSSDMTEALRKRCNSWLNPNLNDSRTGDCNQVVNDIVAIVSRDDHRSLNLAFLDPKGLELHWETVAKLATVRRMDLIINYPENGLNRNMRKEYNTVSQESVDHFFGDRSWRTVYEDWQNRGRRAGLHRMLIDSYKERLRRLGYTEVRQVDRGGTEPLMRNEKRGPLYRLLFASKHPLGDRFWREVTRRDVHGQPHLL